MTEPPIVYAPRGYATGTAADDAPELSASLYPSLAIAAADDDDDDASTASTCKAVKKRAVHPPKRPTLPMGWVERPSFRSTGDVYYTFFRSENHKIRCRSLAEVRRWEAANASVPAV